MATVNESVFGELADGTKILIYTLSNRHGAQARIMTYGGILTSLKVPDRDGALSDVVLGFDDLLPYVEGQGTPYFGALIGRFGNRIAKGRFSLDGRHYRLATNDGRNHLHGGLQGFDKRVWSAHPFTLATAAGVKLSFTSVDGDQGYPGCLTVTATYTLTDNNALDIEFCASTDQATPINLTQHSYFNLSGAATIESHRLQIMGSHFTPVDNQLVPTGEVVPVAGTPLDFRSARPIGERLFEQDRQLEHAAGYDHNFVLDKRKPAGFELAARVEEPTSGRILEVFTEEPGLQFYSGNYLDGSLAGRGRTYSRHSGFCLEPQHFPDSPNRPNFPSTILRPGANYHSRSSFVFSTDAGIR